MAASGSGAEAKLAELGITIPEVVQAFQRQMDRLHGEMATLVERMPTEDVTPEGS